MELQPTETRHPIWYREDGTDIFLVEDTLFKIARNVLAAHSQVFADMFKLPQGSYTESASVINVEGQSDVNPIKIPHITVKEFEYLIEAIFNIDWPRLPFPHDKLIAVLKLSTLYLMIPARNWAIGWLTHENLHPAIRIELAYKYNVADWIEPAFRALLPLKVTSLTIEDTCRIGIRTFAALTKTKEVLQDLRLKVAFSATYLYCLAAECDYPTHCRSNWVSWYWMKVSAKVLNPTLPLSLMDVPKVVAHCDVLCEDCRNLTVIKVNEYMVLGEEDKIIRSTIMCLLDIQKSST